MPACWPNLAAILAVAIVSTSSASPSRTRFATAIESRSPSGSVHEIARAGSQKTTLTRAQIANASFVGIYNDPVQLRHGRYEGPPFVPGGASRPTVLWLEDLYLVRDLDGDGTEDAVVLLAESSGGSGSNLYVAVLTAQGGDVVNRGTALVGDRVQVRSLRNIDDEIRLDIVEQGPGDAACCPTQLSTRTWELREGELVATRSETTGALSLAALAGVEWRLIALDLSEPLPPNIETTLRFEDGRLVGFAGCNRFFLDVREDSPGRVRVGRVGSTSMSCDAAVMELETQYLQRLETVVRYGFVTGRLALTWESETSVGSLLFMPRETSGSD